MASSKFAGKFAFVALAVSSSLCVPTIRTGAP